MEYLAVILFLVFAGYLVQKELNKQSAKYEEGLERINDELDDIRGEISELRQKVWNNKLTPFDKEELGFENEEDISIRFFEELEKGQVVSLVSGSYYYPDEDIHISRFDYKHDHIDTKNQTEYGWEVHGYKKILEENDWSPCILLASDIECSTSSCSGTVKKSNNMF